MMQSSQHGIPYCVLNPAESLSKNIILTKDKVQITPSSFNLNPIKTINL